MSELFTATVAAAQVLGALRGFSRHMVTIDLQPPSSAKQTQNGQLKKGPITETMRLPRLSNDGLLAVAEETTAEQFVGPLHLQPGRAEDAKR